jgi:hypothetical protein
MTRERRLTICSRTEVSSQLSAVSSQLKRKSSECPKIQPRRGVSELSPALYSVCVRTSFWAIRWNEELENPAPEGRTNLAQRFQRWEKWEE